MLKQLILKIQLPPLFTQQDEVDLELLNYKFDPNARLSLSKQNETIYNVSNVGSILPLITEQSKKVIKMYDNKDWKNLLRPLQSFAFEIELRVRVKNIKQPTIKIKPIEAKLRSELYQLLILDNNELPKEEELMQKINALARNLLEKIQQKGKLSQRLPLSFAPQKVFNPHLFIKTGQKQKHIQYYTKGIYEYYHYGDQSFNDHGWGCAYRSLQSLLSWFNLQNHCKLSSMPTITQIQDIIDQINLGSKQKLKNSREWIGATEVSWVIKRLTNYDCRILHISDGKNIIEHCEMFRQHFEKVGSPVMYGGGEYAYSIVGLNYSWQLGECEFLILDPHYPGNDSLDKIFEKKGLVWRKPDEMFKKGIFYNFCLPLIPVNE